MGDGLPSNQHPPPCCDAAVENIAVTMLERGLVTLYLRSFSISILALRGKRGQVSLMSTGPKALSTKAVFTSKPIMITQVFIFYNSSAVRRHVGKPWAKCPIFPGVADVKRSKPGLALSCASLLSGSSQLCV